MMLMDLMIVMGLGPRWCHSDESRRDIHFDYICLVAQNNPMEMLQGPAHCIFFIVCLDLWIAGPIFVAVYADVYAAGSN